MATTTSTPAMTDREMRAACRVLDSLERVNLRNDQLYSTHRQHERRSLRTILTIALPAETGAEGAHLNVLAYNLSQGGCGFLSSQPLVAPVLRVGLTLADGKMHWFDGTIVRVKEIPGEGFWDYGVSFRARHVG